MHLTTSCLRGNSISPFCQPDSHSFCSLQKGYMIVPQRYHVSHCLWVVARESFNMVRRECPSGETVPQEHTLLIFSMATNHNARNTRKKIIRFLSWRPKWLQEIWSNTFFKSFVHFAIIVPKTALKPSAMQSMLLDVPQDCSRCPYLFIAY